MRPERASDSKRALSERVRCPLQWLSAEELVLHGAELGICDLPECGVCVFRRGMAALERAVRFMTQSGNPPLFLSFLSAIELRRLRYGAEATRTGVS